MIRIPVLCAQPRAFLFGVAALIAVASGTNAATINLDLTCPLNGLNSGSCSPGPVFGTITLEDLSGVDAGKVEVTVDLGMPDGQKFRDLILNYSGAATTITDNDPGNAVVLVNNGYSINPYNGLFDLGESGGQGWNASTSGPYSTILSGNAPLSTADFAVLDSLGKLYAAIHIQDIGSATGGNCDGSGDPALCVPGMEGSGSLKIGAPNLGGPGDPEVPEPSSLVLLSLLVAGVGAGGFRCRRS